MSIAYPGCVNVRLHMQALLADGAQQLDTIDGHHIGQDVLVEGGANDILSTAWHTVALQP